MFVVNKTEPAVETKPVTPAPAVEVKPAVKKEPLQKVEYNGLFYAPALKKFVDPETDVPISDFTFEWPHSQQLLFMPPGNPISFPTEDTTDWIMEVVKGLPNFWYARKIEQRALFLTDSAKQWTIEVVKRDGRALLFSPGLFAIVLIKHGEKIALESLDAEFPKG